MKWKLLAHILKTAFHLFWLPKKSLANDLRHMIVEGSYQKDPQNTINNFCEENIVLIDVMCKLACIVTMVYVLRWWVTTFWGCRWWDRILQSRTDFFSMNVSQRSCTRITKFFVLNENLSKQKLSDYKKSNTVTRSVYFPCSPCLWTRSLVYIILLRTESVFRVSILI